MNRLVQEYLLHGIMNETKKLTDKLTKDLKQFENTLKRLKETNFNKQKLDDYNKTSDKKYNSDNYLQNMLYIDKYAISILSNFITRLQNLEQKRLTFASKYWACYSRCVYQYLNELAK